MTTTPQTDGSFDFGPIYLYPTYTFTSETPTLQAQSTTPANISGFTGTYDLTTLAPSFSSASVYPQYAQSWSDSIPSSASYDEGSSATSISGSSSSFDPAFTVPASLDVYVQPSFTGLSPAASQTPGEAILGYHVPSSAAPTPVVASASRMSRLISACASSHPGRGQPYNPDPSMGRPLPPPPDKFSPPTSHLLSAPGSSIMRALSPGACGAPNPVWTAVSERVEPCMPSTSPIPLWRYLRLLNAMPTVLAANLLAPRGLIALGQSNQGLREIVKDEKLYELWFETLMAGKLVKKFEKARALEHVSKREFVLLALGHFCMDCKTEYAGHVYIQLKRRVCLRCLVELDAYATMPLTKAMRKYAVKKLPNDAAVGQPRLVAFEVTMGAKFEVTMGTKPTRLVCERAFKKFAEALRATSRNSLDEILAARELPQHQGYDVPMTPPKPKYERMHVTEQQDRAYRLASALAIGWLLVTARGAVVHDPSRTCAICARVRELVAGKRPQAAPSRAAEAEMPASAHDAHVREHVRALGAACQPWCRALFAAEDARAGDCAVCVNRRAVQDVQA